ARREPRPAAAAKARRLHLVDDRVLPDGEQRLGIVPVAPGLGRLQIGRLEAVNVGEDAVLVRERPGITHQNAPASWAMNTHSNASAAKKASLIIPFTNLNAKKARRTATMMARIVI